MAWLDSQIQAGKEVFDNAKAHLNDVLDLARNAHQLYMSLDDNLRRLCSQAFFDKIWITDIDTINADIHEGFATVLHPGIQQAALAADFPGDDYNLDAFDHAIDVRGLNIPSWVELTGLEPVSSTHSDSWSYKG